ncbi:hypothetical protein J21TS3_28860 [Paenibacillus cookii]|uniref:Uncharacterized protein n=1 Tax=Paenibacillus cookii TaxID=157839 RepID=A0ABQ4LXQ4_9BACL|nr:hypothetical protein J21TS3_28860 [Paenibacillus cookii]
MDAAFLPGIRLKEGRKRNVFGRDEKLPYLIKERCGGARPEYFKRLRPAAARAAVPAGEGVLS